MKKTSIVIHQKYIEDVIKDLHETGFMEIINITKEKPETLKDFEKAEMHPEASVCTTYDLRLTRLIDILDGIRSKPSGIKAMLHPQLPEIKTVEECPLDELYSRAEGILGEIEKKILAHEGKLKTLDERRQKIKSDISQIEYLKDFDLDIADIGESEYLIVKAGKTLDIDILTKEVNSLKNAVIYSKRFGTGKKIEYAVIVAVHISEKEKFEKICREYITEFNIDITSGIPKNILKTLRKENSEITKEKKKINLQLKNFAKNQFNDLLALREEIQLETIRREIPKNFAKTASTYVINGWILEKNEEQLKTSIEKVSDGCLVYESKVPSLNPDNPPTHIETPRWANGFKSLLEMFATPRYNELNPTILMGIFFVLFFGVMLGDAGYGSIILILSLLGYFKFGKYSEMIKSWAFMGIWIGLVTTIFGVLTYSIFGDLIHRFFFNSPVEPIYSFNLLGIHFPVESLNDPLAILTLALILGLIHLNVGVILGIYQAFKQKKYKEMLTERLCWVPLQIGGGMLIGYFILGWGLSQTLFYAAGIMVVIGLIQLFIASGPIGFFDITGYVGDWLSYARLLALGLATSGMALAFNVVSQLLGDMIPIKIIGMIVMVILLVIMHMVNLGLQALGAGVHSLRLQYVEFFNRFYEGGGKMFSPFKINRRYTKIEEKNVD
jgi:V/A-type H+-transporting ATPase subunit I